jgi:hypothetical protein
MKKKNLFNVAVASVMLSLLTLVAAPAHAAGPADISSFVACLNSTTTTSQPAVDAVACVPSPGCYTTLTVSEESAQPGCTLADGTSLPRVIFSCPGSGGSLTLRFRPSFTLCTLGQGTLMNHIELGDDLNSIVDSRRVQKMADVDATVARPLTEFGIGITAVVDAPGNSKGCAECHDLLGTAGTGATIFNRFAPIRPAVAEGTIFTNDPRVTAPSGQKSLSDTFTDICNGIKNSSQLQRNPGRQSLALSLCSQLAAKAQNQ